jgi:NAD(P)-dependent dehydrogenase (short-subunit alcohol dehydrogenase family)
MCNRYDTHSILSLEETIPQVSLGEISMDKVVIVTGVSSGLGKAFATALLHGGFKVVGTVRKQEAVEEFERLQPGAAFARVLDVTDSPEKLSSVLEEIEKHVGPVYALINNAGYGHEGTLEESSMEELRQQFEVNVFGAVAMIKAVLPFMRARREGRIINITSMGGLMTMPGLSYYHGSKFALEGISSSLAKEVKPLGIYVTAVEPGMFRTDWAGRSMVRSERNISDYDAIFDPIRAARQLRNGNQPGDPAKAGDAMTTLLLSHHPPLHLLLGSDAFDYVHKELEQLRGEFSDWEPLTRSTNFEQTA